jgi:myo-inositol-1-phosphate synthase
VIVVDRRAEAIGVDDVIEVLMKQAADVLICCIPSGAHQAVLLYAEAAAKAGAAFINCTAAPAAHDAATAALFAQHGVPLLGDDLRSHVGATTIHTMLLELFASRGVEILNTYQLNFGGNRDFLNLSDRNRSAWKIASKMRALHASANVADDVWAGPNGFVPSLGDVKVCHLMIEGRSTLNSRIAIDIKLQVEDSPNAASVMVNAVRVAAVERRRGTRGIVDMPAGYLFKSPVVAVSPSEAEACFARYVLEAAI